MEFPHLMEYKIKFVIIILNDTALLQARNITLFGNIYISIWDLYQARI